MAEIERDWLEEWRPTPEAPGYEASSLGRVRGPGGILKQIPNRDGYLMVSVKIDGVWTSRQVGACVCAAFHGPRPEGHEADHRDTHRQRNTPGNLRWLPQGVNKSLAAHETGEDRHGAKLTSGAVAYIRKHYVPFSRTWGGHALARRFGVSGPTIMSVVRERRWRPKSRAQETRELVG
jgi:hypothetical protein